MKIRCTCDNIIVDQTDYLKYKGYIISDTQWFNFWETIDKETEKSSASKKDNKDNIIQVRLQKLFKTAWECSNCGKLFIEGKNGGLIEYSSDNNRYNQVLDKLE